MTRTTVVRDVVFAMLFGMTMLAADDAKMVK
jgi:hypothetical protein